jgi:hypothetical protein
VKEQVAAFPQPSFAVYVTVVVPCGKVDPELCVVLNVGTLQLSVAVGTTQVTGVVVLVTVRFDGHPVITGLV